MKNDAMWVSMKRDFWVVFRCALIVATIILMGRKIPFIC